MPDAYKGANGQPLPFQTALQTLTGQQNLPQNQFNQYLQGLGKDDYSKLLQTGFVQPMYKQPYQDNSNMYDAVTY